MKHFLLFLIFAFTSLSIAEQTDSTSIKKDSTIVKEETIPQTTQPVSKESKWYYGGSFGFSFWNDYYSLGVYPLAAYKVTPKLSVGGKIGYTYIHDNRYDPYPALNSSNYGGSVFTRYRLIPQIYAHAEFVYYSFEEISSFNIQDKNYNTERVWVPFILLGGGVSQNIGPNVWAFAEVLFDVLQDPNSPYNDWDPFISIGVGVGF